LVTQGTIETRITDLIAQKRAVFEALFDGTSDEVRFDESSSFMTQVREAVQTFTSRDTAPAESDDAEVEAMDVAREDGKFSDELVLDVGSQSDSPVEEKMVSAEANIKCSPSSVPNARQVAEFMRGVRFERAPDGAIRIEADGAAAAVLSEAFMSMGRMFGALASPSVSQSEQNLH
jgi:hypothetical protein